MKLRISPIDTTAFLVFTPEWVSRADFQRKLYQSSQQQLRTLACPEIVWMIHLISEKSKFGVVLVRDPIDEDRPIGRFSISWNPDRKIAMILTSTLNDFIGSTWRPKSKILKSASDKLKWRNSRIPRLWRSWKRRGLVSHSKSCRFYSTMTILRPSRVTKGSRIRASDNSASRSNSTRNILIPHLVNHQRMKQEINRKGVAKGLTFPERWDRFCVSTDPLGNPQFDFVLTEIRHSVTAKYFCLQTRHMIWDGELDSFQADVPITLVVEENRLHRTATCIVDQCCDLHSLPRRQFGMILILPQVPSLMKRDS